jgi:hypothetical protein
MNIRSFTKQKVETLQKEIERLEAIYTVLVKTTPSEMWVKDLDEFSAEYARVYK